MYKREQLKKLRGGVSISQMDAPKERSGSEDSMDSKYESTPKKVVVRSGANGKI